MKLSTIPRRTAPWEESPEGLVTARAKRTSSRLLMTVFPMLRREVKIRLDETGSAMWKMLDGQLSVKDIAWELSGHVDNPKDMEERVVLYLRELASRGLVQFDSSDDSVPSA